MRSLIWRNILAVLILAAGLAVARADADRAAPAARFIDGLVGEALATIRDPSLSDADRRQRFETLLDRGFDMPRIARYVLGRYWLTASEAERQDFARVFERWLVQTYGSRFKSYSGEQVKVVGAREEAQGAVVTTELISPSGAPPLRLEWRVAVRGDDYNILDIDVAGVSMALTERDEIAAVIQRSGGTVASATKVFADRIGVPATAAAEPR
jgi:phospholipid transport system substrate-binding protein